MLQEDDSRSRTDSSKGMKSLSFDIYCQIALKNVIKHALPSLYGSDPSHALAATDAIDLCDVSVPHLEISENSTVSWGILSGNL